MTEHRVSPWVPMTDPKSQKALGKLAEESKWWQQVQPHHSVSA